MLFSGHSYFPESEHDRFSTNCKHSESEAGSLINPVERKEVELALFNANPDKAPGLDGFNLHFYKVCWNVIGDETVEAVVDFFN